MSDLTELGRAVEYIKGKLDIISEAVLGAPGDEQKPGILIRLDRLERSIALMKRVISVIIGAGVSTIVAVGAAFLVRSI